MEKTYFEKPTQIVFADPDNPGEWLSGIAYREVIICGCCGGVFEIADVLESAGLDGVKNAIYEYSRWDDLANEIVGGELPEGLEFGEFGIIETPDDYEQYAFTLEEEDEETARVNEVENLN